MSWLDVPTTRMSIFIIFENAGVLFEGAFSLRVSLKNLYSVTVYWLFQVCGLDFGNNKLWKGLLLIKFYYLTWSNNIATHWKVFFKDKFIIWQHS